jgi:hypothetical protein
MQLEPRIMFDAAAVATADATVKTELADSAAKNTADATASEARHEVAFVDPALQNSKQLLSGLDKVIEVVSLQSGQDPLKQISDYLASHNNISALHLFSHGTPGSVTLGNTVLAADTLNDHAQQLESWKLSLTTDADILLYSCDVAAGSKGEAFITQLSILTGADVTASTDPTGAAAKGGDWDLERSTGVIEATVLNVAGFDALMAAPVNTVPTARTVAEDNTITFSAANSNAISIADADGTVQSVSISVTHGTITLSGSTGLTASGDGTASISITAGSITDINNALNGLIYRPTKDYAGADTLTIATNDGSTTDTDTVGITITANATAPVLTLPAAAQTVREDVSTYLNFTDITNAITLTDADANDLQTLTLSVAHGTLNIKTDVGGGVTSTVGNGTASVILSGTAAQLSATLAHENGVQYTSVLNYNSSYTTAGPETLSFNLNDGVHTQTGTVAMNVTQVNDAPTLTGAGAATVQEGGSVSFNRAQLASSDNALDVDIQTGQQFISQLMVKIVSLPGSGTLTYKSGAVVVGSIVPVSSLGDLKYTHNGTDIVSNATVTFDVTVSDGGGSLPTAGTISIIITPKNVAPTISGSPSLIEGQVKVVAPAINLGDGFDTLANSTIVIDNVVNGSQGTLFIDANNNNVVDAGEALALSGSSTILDAAQRANLATQLKFFQNGYEPNTPLAVSPSYGITVTDAGGGQGAPSAATATQTITLTILPNNDDPTLANSHATVGTALTAVEGHVTPITAAMLQISDADLNPANTAQNTPANQLVYTIGTRPTQGEIQVNIGGVLGYNADGWITLGDGGRFTQAQVTAGEVRYYQTTNVAVATNDNFTFTVRDSAFGYDVWSNPANPTSDREGGLRASPTTAIATQQFYFYITPLAAHSRDTWEGGPRAATPGYGGSMTYTFEHTPGMLSNNSTAGGSWVEANVGAVGGGYLITSGMLSYTITRTDTVTLNSVEVPTNETVYTLTSQPPNGTVQRLVGGSWQAIPTNGQFTQADINAGNIRFVHDGGEDHIASFGYKVSDGTPYHYDDTFGLDITPTNDRPTGSGGSVEVLEGSTSVVRLGSSALGMADIDLSLDPAKQTGEGAADFLWFKIVAQPVDGGAVTRGELQRWNGTAWVTVTPGEWLPRTLLTMTAGVGGDEATSGLRYKHDGTEPLAYTGSPNVTFQYQVRDDLANPADPLATNVTAVANTSESAQSNQSANATTTIKIIPVNNAPQIADIPVADADNPYIGDTITDGGALIGKNAILVNVPEGGAATITSALLTGIDPDNTTVQRQYQLKSLPTQGVLLLSSKVLGLGSTFTQDDIDNNRVTYRHNGGEITATTTDTLGGPYNDKFHFVLSDAVAEDTGTGASNYNTFLISLTTTNDAPTLTGPTGIILIDSATPANNLVKDGATVFVIADPDLANGVQDGETDFVQATVRLLDSAGNPITDYEYGFDGGGVSIGYTAQAGGLWKVTQTGTNNILQIQGTRDQVNAALAGLSVTFANDTNLMYKVQVIADDRMRDISGALDITSSDANGGDLNQGTTAGAAPVAVPGTVYDWKTAIEVPAVDGNIAAASVDIRASRVNEPATFTGPASQTVNEDVRTQITATFAVDDPESAAFNTPITVTLTVTSGTLDVAGQGTTQTSFTPSGGQPITISGDRTTSITLTGRAADIQALLNQKNFANNAPDTNGGLFYTSPNNGNHDYNGGSAGDVTLTLSFDDSGSRFGDDAGAGSVAKNPPNIIIPLTITPVNDVPTVTATSTPIAINGITAVEGFEINDVDYTDGGGILTPETDFVQATIRLLPATGTTPLTEGQHAIVTFGSSSAPLESAVVGSEFEIDDTNTGSGKALVIRGTQAKVNAYLSGLTVALSTVVNDNTTYRVEVVADDRLRVLATGALAGSGAANGGLNSDGSTGTANVPVTDVDPYTATPALAYNVASNTRTILGSSLNEAPSFSGLDANPTFVENGAAVVLDANATIGDPELTAYNNWDNAVLTLARDLGANSDDVFGVTGSVDSGINFNGANIRNGTTVVGTFTNNSGTLAITFNSSATNTVVNSVLQAITYSNSNNDPPGDVTIKYTINDGDTDPDRAGNGQGANGPLPGIGSITVGVTAINDAPTFNTGVAAAFTENAVSPTVIDSLLTITDLDDTQMTGATVSITGNFKTGEDILAVNGTAIGNIISGTTITVASYDGTTGVLTLTGTDTKANYQAALRSVSYTTASDDPTVTTKTTRTITFGVTDANSHGVGAGAQTSTVTRSINITPLADAPVLAGAGQTLLYTENGDAAVIDATVNVASDADDTQMARATITISANRTDGDTLSFTNQNGISGSYTAGTGVMTLTGNATLANYTTALQSIKFRSTSDDPTATSASRTITWQVTDANSDSAGAASSNTVSSFITITPTVDAPTLGGALPNPSYTENGATVALDGNVTVSDVDDTNIVSAIITISNNLTEGDTLNFTDQNGITGSYAGGVLTLTGSATLANYTTAMKSVTFSSTSDDPTVNATKTTRSITWTVTDANSELLGAQTSSTRTTSLTVNPAIDNPVMSAGGTLAYTENQAAAVIDATVNVASDADDTQMAGATITISAGYTAGDTLTFVPQNGITIVSNVGGVLTLAGTTTLANYTTALRSVQYSSTSDDPTATSASRTITWRVTDANSDAAGAGTSAAVTSTINITVGNEHPVLTPAVGNGAYTENATATLVDNAITVTDADDTNITGGTISITGGFLAGDLLAITNTGAISGSYAAGTGILTLTGTDTLANYQTVLRSLTYLNNTEDPTSNASKPTRTITYSLTDANSDGVGAATGTVTKTINVTALTDNPVMSSGGTLAYTENQAAQVIDGGVSVVSDADDTDIAGATITISAGYTAGDTLTFVPQNGITIVSNVGGVLTLTGTTTRAQYTAALQSIKFHSTSEDPTATSTSRTVTWRVTDANSDAAGAGTSDAVTSTINIAAVNDAPVAVADTGTTPENVTLTVAAGSGVLVNDTDVDTSDTHTVSEVNGVPGNVATGVTGSNGGTFTIAADGSYVFNPGTAFNDLFVGESRTTSVTYTNLDSNGLSASSTLTITVTGINAVPVPAPPPPDLPGAPPLGPPPPTADPPAVIIPGYYSFNDPASTLLGSLSQYGDNGDGAGGGIGGGDATDNIYGYDLYLVKTPSSQEMLVDEVGSFNLPTGTFRHSSGNAKISLEASLADGSPLPEWLTFDPDSGRFTGKPPKGTGGAMDIKILARDDRGNVAFAQFLLHITEQESNDAQTIKERQTDSNAEGIDSYHLKPTDHDKDKPQQPKRRYAALGRSSLSDQFKQQQLRGRNEALLETLQRTTVRLQ